MDTVQPGVPVIPAGTENTVYGTPTFRGTPSEAVVNSGYTPSTPDSGKSSEALQGVPQVAQVASPETPTFERLAAEKGYKTPDDLAKAYVEAVQQKTRAEMGLNELVKVRDEATQSQAAIPQLVLEPQQVQTPEDAIRVVNDLIAKRVRPLEDQIQLQTLFSTNPDAKEYASDMAQIIKLNPAYKWDDAYKLAKFAALEEKAREQGKQEAYQAIQQKQAVLTGAGIKAPAGSERSIQDLIADRSVPFSEVQRIMRERFIQ